MKRIFVSIKQCQWNPTEISICYQDKHTEKKIYEISPAKCILAQRLNNKNKPQQKK